MSKAPLFRQLCAGTSFKSKPTKESQTIELTDTSHSSDDELRSFNKIHISGDDIPDLVKNFDELNSRYAFSSVLSDNLRSCNYMSPTPCQMQAIPLMMEHREFICCAPTGSGKTLAYILPIISKLNSPKKFGFRAIIIAPTRELVRQIHRESLWLANGTGLRIHTINNVMIAAKKFVGRKLFKDILITTPRRLTVLLKTSPPLINLKHLRWLVIDECDKLFEMGFRDQLSFIYKECSKSTKVQRAMFSATFDTRLEKWLQMNLNDVATLIVGGKNHTSTFVQQQLRYVGSESNKYTVLKEIIASGIETPALLFVAKIEKGIELHKKLLKEGLKVECLHSNKTQDERDNIVTEFRSGNIDILISTDLIGRGIDFRAVSFIINFDVPGSPIAYIHRVGRTGRAGKYGKAVTLFTDSDFRLLKPIIKVMLQSGCDVAEFLKVFALKPSKKTRGERQKISSKRNHDSRI